MNSGLLIAAVLLVVGTGALLSRLLARERPFFNLSEAVSAPTMGTVAVLFGLFVTFGSSDGVQRSRELRLAVQREANVARSILRFCESVGPSATELREATIEYLQAATTRDRTWLVENSSQQAPSQGAADDLVQLVTMFVSLAKVADPVKSLIVTKVDELRQARTERLNLLQSPSSIPQWIGLVLMAIMTQVSIGLAHIDRRRAASAAIWSFTVVAVSAMIYLSWIEGIIGPSRVDSTLLPLETILRTL
jgi:hypothetical protein